MSTILANVKANRAMETLQTDVVFLELNYQGVGPGQAIPEKVKVLAKAKRQMGVQEGDCVVVALANATTRNSPRTYSYRVYQVVQVKASSGLALDDDQVVPWAVQKVDPFSIDRLVQQESEFLAQWNQMQQERVAKETRETLMAHLEASGMNPVLLGLVNQEAEDFAGDPV